MSRVRALSISLALSLSIGWGCGSESPTTTIADDYFPEAIGSRWTYAAFSSSESDTTLWDITVVDSSTNWGTGTRWVSAARTDQMAALVPFGTESYVFHSGDTVGFHTSRPGPPYMSLIIPLETGRIWSNTAGRSDTTRVTGAETLTVPAGSFSDVYHLARMITYEDCWETVDLWFKPRVGIVKVHMEGGGAVCFPVVKTWELIDYEFPARN